MPVLLWLQNDVASMCTDGSIDVGPKLGQREKLEERLLECNVQEYMSPGTAAQLRG